MSVHESEWKGMTIDERVDRLRFQLLAQEAIIAAMIQGLRSIGIDLVMRGPSDQPDE